MKITVRGAAALVSAAALLAACAMMEARKKENLLETAGFRLIAANNPERIQALNTLPAGKISKVTRNGEDLYVYPDRDDCRCLRVGRQPQYELYQRLAKGKNETLLEVTNATTNSGAFKGDDPW